MDIGKITAVLSSPSKAAISALLDDESTVFWIDWRQEDETIPESCELVLQTGSLSGELIDNDSDEGFEVFIQYRDRRIKVPLSYSADDRHITLCALNQILAPEFEVRFCIDSNGNDTIAFVPLPCAQWAAFERQYGDAVKRHFYRIAERPNLFTDRLPF